jgi:hypothetical protein
MERSGTSAPGTIHFVTAGDHCYLVKAACLIQSFLATGSKGTFWFFAADARAATIMRRLALPGLRLVEEPEYQTPALRHLKTRRTALEYSCTAKPIILQHVMKTAASGEWVVWLDGDMFFFQPAQFIVPTGEASVLLTEHHFTPAFAHYRPTVGTFNAGLVAFRKTPAGTACLNFWAQQCLEWCGEVPEAIRYTDQKYLESFADQGGEVARAQSLGVNAGPWSTIERTIQRAGNKVFIGSDPLILYHFQGLRIIKPFLYDLYAERQVRLPVALKELVYQPYVQALKEMFQRVRAIVPRFSAGTATGLRRSVLSPLKRLLLRQGNVLVA